MKRKPPPRKQEHEYLLNYLLGAFRCLQTGRGYSPEELSKGIATTARRYFGLTGRKPRVRLIMQ